MPTIQKDQSQIANEEHEHDGINSKKIHFNNLLGFIQTVSTIPTNAPKSINDQIMLYCNGTTYRLYVYDVKNTAWRYVALT